MVSEKKNEIDGLHVTLDNFSPFGETTFWNLSEFDYRVENEQQKKKKKKKKKEKKEKGEHYLWSGPIRHGSVLIKIEIGKSCG